VNTYPLGATNSTVYVPGATPANLYCPNVPGVDEVWVTSITVPVESSNRTVTPPNPGSPVSCFPFPFSSSNTRSPMKPVPR
jgi:hypothetical protein